MDSILNRLPKGLIAFVAILLGIAFFILSDPPRNICDAELENFKNIQEKFLFKKVYNNFQEANTNNMTLRLDYCKRTNTPGGCYEYFHQLKIFLGSLNNISSDCRGKIGEVGVVKNAIFKSLGLINLLAWGDKPPESMGAKMGWLSLDDLNVFCQLKLKVHQFYEEEEWSSLREKLLKNLPGAEKMSRAEVWRKSILSMNCQKYL